MSLSSFFKKLFSKRPMAQPQPPQQISIDFPDQHQVGETGVNFPARIDGRRVGCEITFEALQDRFHVLDQNFAAGYLANRNDIEELARQLIRANPRQNIYRITSQNP